MQSIRDMTVRFGERHGGYATLVIRLVVGVLFFAHGYLKLAGGVDKVALFFTRVGIPFTPFTAWLVTLVEFLGGIGMVLGIGTRYFGIMLSFDMLIAILVVKLPMGLLRGFQLELSLLAVSLSLVFSGCGLLSRGQSDCRRFSSPCRRACSARRSP
jgi:putative oxidoreductase